MKNKYIKLAVLLIGLNANAQINIQASPNLSISKENPFLDASGYNTFQNSVGKGLYFPKTDLTTWEFKLNSITPSSFSTYFDGMIVYNSGTGQTIQDTKKGGKRVKVTPGFYYFKNPGQNFPNGNVSNGQWVRLGADAESFSELWAQRQNGSTTETYLKPATANNDEYMYSPKKSYINLGSVQQTDLDNLYNTPDPRNADIKNHTPQLTMISSSALSTNADKSFSRDVFNIKPTQGQNIANAKYTGKDSWTFAKDLGANIDYITGLNQHIDFVSSSNVRTLLGGKFTSSSGNGNVTRNIALNSRPIQYSGSTDTMIGLLNEPTVFGGNVNNIYGIQTSINSTQATDGAFPNLNLKYMIGNRITMVTNPNTTAERAYGAIFYNYFKNNSTISKEGTGVVTSGYFEAGSNVKDYTGYTAYVNGVSDATVDKIYGYRLSTGDLKDGFVTREMYGLYLEHINKGTEKNYAIYTKDGTVRFGDKVGVGVDNPTEQLEVAGAVKVGSTTNTCTATNAGTMSYKEVNGSGVFGFCTKTETGDYVWFYFKGGQPHGTSANGASFGAGL